MVTQLETLEVSPARPATGSLKLCEVPSSSSSNLPVTPPNIPISTFLGLKWTLLLNGFKRSTWVLVFAIIGALSVLGAVGFAIFGAIVGGGLNIELTGQILIAVGALAVLCWLLLPLMMFGVDATIDPHRFSLYPLPLSRLMLGLAGAGVIGIPGLASLLAFAGVALAWWRTPAVLPLALIGAIGALALCIIGSRSLTTWLAPKLEKRRIKEIIAVIIIIPLVLSGSIIAFFAERIDAAGGFSAEMFGRIANVIGWTPFGAPWGIPAAAAAGEWFGAVMRLLVLAASLVGLWLLWQRSLRRALEHPAEQATKSAPAKGLGWFGRLPATPTGAVAARTATYWVRDPRYAVSLAIIPLFPVMFLVGTQTGTGATEGVEFWIGALMAIILGPLTGWVMGFSVSNDVAYDYTAFALHLSTGVPARADRLGRILPMLTIGVPLTAIFSIISAAVIGHWAWLPALIGVSWGSLFAALGVSAASSAKFVYPVPKPGESPFKQPQGAAGAQMLGQFAAMGVSFLVSLPILGLGVWAILGNSLVVGWLTSLLAPAIGIVVLILGVRFGARLLEANGPELLQKVHNFA
ncbi:MAG: hypothetical protein FWG25_03070 [Promicromonosporaceae bacterium]|nr:hypothetical protein [Promicromonosporaceae bacterium]